MAHAHMTIDLAPGHIVARECVESLRFGTPIVVPDASISAAHARAGGGVTFSDVPELLEGVELLMGEAERGLFSRRGADYANSTYGDAPRFVASITKALVPS